MDTKTPESRPFACGEKFFLSLFRQAGCAGTSMEGTVEEIIKEMKQEAPDFFIFSQKAFEKVKDEFKENFGGCAYIVFPLPGERDHIEEEVAEMVKTAVGVEL